MKKPKHDRQPKDRRPFLGGTLYVNRSAHPLLYGMCLVLGLLFLYAGAVLPLFRFYASHQWAAVPCTIMASGLKSDGGRSYTEDVVYAYEVAGKTYQGNRYGLVQSWHSRITERKRIEADLVTRYPPGSRATCYVNPDNPAEAILHRHLNPVGFWYAPLALILTMLGAWGLQQRRGHQRP